MYSLQGFAWLDFKLRDAERGVWRSVLGDAVVTQCDLDWASLSDHAAKILHWAKLNSVPAVLVIAGGRRTLARMELYRRLLAIGHHQTLLETRLSDVWRKEELEDAEAAAQW